MHIIADLIILNLDGEKILSYKKKTDIIFN